jgi:hypothetical protein
MTEMMWSLLPSLTFTVATPLVDRWPGLAAGLLVAIVVLGRAIAHRKAHMFEVARLASFIGLAAFLAVEHRNSPFLATHRGANQRIDCASAPWRS